MHNQKSDWPKWSFWFEINSFIYVTEFYFGSILEMVLFVLPCESQVVTRLLFDFEVG